MNVGSVADARARMNSIEQMVQQLSGTGATGRGATSAGTVTSSGGAAFSDVLAATASGTDAGSVVPGAAGGEGVAPYGAQSYGAQSFGTQSYGAQSYGAQSYGAQSYGVAGTAFSGRFSGTVGAAVPAGGTRWAAVQQTPGSYGKLQPPSELLQYGNGRIPAAALEPVGVGSHRLWGPAAQAFKAMRAAAARDGVQVGLTDSYRDLPTQVSLARRKGLYSQGGWAAAPGTSNHGWGMAVDVDVDQRGQAWMRANGWKYGFVEDTPREPWHWGFRPAAGTSGVAG